MNLQNLTNNLFEKGINLEIDQEMNRVTLQMSEIATKNIIGVAAGDNIEQALSTLIHKLTDDSQSYKSLTVKNQNMLSKL